MRQPIVAFARDAIDDPVAVLACGHCQHVRHRPPWTCREWVLSEAGRDAALGRTLDCRKCDRGEPRDVSPGPSC